MFEWIIEALQGITETHGALVMMIPFCIGALNDGESHEQGFERLEGELTTANQALATAKEAGGKGFYGSLSEEVRNNPSMMKFDKSSNEDIAKSYISLQSKISAKGVTIPGKNASEEEVGNFYKAIGRPDTADGYSIVVPEKMHGGVVSTPESQKDFKNQCHKMGFTAEQTQGLHSWYVTKLSNALTQQDAEDEKVTNDAKTALQAKWGTTYEPKLALANRMVGKFGGEKVFELFKDGLGANPLVLEMLANIGDKLGEDALGPGGHSQFGALTPDAAQAKINETLNAPATHAYHDGNNPLHKEAVEEMTTLYKIVAAGEEQK